MLLSVVIFTIELSVTRLTPGGPTPVGFLTPSTYRVGGSSIESPCSFPAAMSCISDAFAITVFWTAKAVSVSGRTNVAIV